MTKLKEAYYKVALLKQVLKGNRVNEIKKRYTIIYNSIG